MSDEARRIFKMVADNEAYEIKFRQWSWIVAKHTAYPLKDSEVVKYPGAADQVLSDRDYVIWCQSPLGKCRLKEAGLLTNNWYMLRSTLLHMQ